MHTLAKRYCKNINIQLVFTSFKIGRFFSTKDSVPRGSRSRVVYKFVCAGCNACYIGETFRHLSTRVREHLGADKNSNVFKHLRESKACSDICSKECFTIIDSASTKFSLRIKKDYMGVRVFFPRWILLFFIVSR